MPHSIFAKF